MYLLLIWLELKGPHYTFGHCQKTLWNLKIQIDIKYTFQFCLKHFNKPCSKNFGRNIWVPIPIQQYQNMLGYNYLGIYNLSVIQELLRLKFAIFTIYNALNLGMLSVSFLMYGHTSHFQIIQPFSLVLLNI